MKEVVIYSLVYFLIVATFLPFAKSKHWFFRNFDYIRLQVLFLLGFSFILSLFFIETNNYKIVTLIAAALSILVQFKIISPYINLNWKEKKEDNNNQVIKLLSCNIYQENRNYKAFIELVNKLNPDLILVMETDQEWVNNISILEKDYPYFEKAPFNNTYGMCFYSKLKINKVNTHFYLQEDRPSIEAHIQTENNQEFVFYGIHPPPPSPTEEETSKEKDGELMLIAKHIRTLKKPVIAAGDFNNVCWSNITTLFSTVSNLKDCRINNGFFSTFPVKPFFLRFPLDLLYCSNEIQIDKMLVKENIDSDHLPFYVEFWIVNKNQQEKETLESETIEKTKEIIKEGKEEAA